MLQGYKGWKTVQLSWSPHYQVLNETDMEKFEKMMAKKFINKFPFSSFPPTNILCSSMEDDLSKSIPIFARFTA